MIAKLRLWWQGDLPFVLIAGSVIIVYIAVTLVALFLGWGWKGTEYIAVTSLAFAILSVVVSSWMGRRAKEVAKEETSRAAIVQALQEEKESIGNAVQALKRKGLSQYKPSYRKEVLESLVLAAIFTGSDRARMMIFSVLLENYDEYRTEIEEIVISLEKMLNRFRSFDLSKEELDLRSAGLRLGALGRVLKGPTANK